MKYCKGMSIKKEKDVVNEKPITSIQEESKAVSYFKSFMSTTPTVAKKEKQDKNEPARFLGDGVSFKAKLIGILEVSEARGDRMCQEALADLKMAIRAAGEHKQRININIAIDGLRLRDEKTGDCLYHHPVHRISFIAQDMSDSRAFGYIFGAPDTGHRFFGIKTDKAASQVVITMRDLFQVVFELKKKEIEMAKQHIEQHQLKYSGSLFPESSTKTSIDTLKIRTTEDHAKGSTSTIDRRENSEHIMDLLDLELELNNIQQGINQMDRITPSDPFGPPVAPKSSALDPFGDSFNPLQSRAKIPPPPESGKKNKNIERHWFDQETEALFEETELPSTLSSHQPTNLQATFPISTVSVSPLPVANEANSEDLINKKLETSIHREQFDVFTDLDPLGTGRSKPYIDKKDFFQDLKNPPKKVLKDLVSELPSDCKQLSTESESGTSSHQNPKIDKKNKTPSADTLLYSDPFQGDPFDKDPFSDIDFSNTLFTSDTNSDPFEKFADFSSFDVKKDDLTCSEKTKSLEEDSKAPPLRVSLPPEKINTIETVPMSPHQSRKANRLQKNNTISCIIKPLSPVLKRNKLVSQPSLDHLERNSPIMEGVTIRSRTTNFYPSVPTNSFSDTLAPEPPPRSALNSVAMKPPPLPPKRLAVSASSKPPPRPPQSDYDYIENYHTTSYTDVNSPPLPAPARKLKPSQQKPSVEPEYYLQPFPLLPPPKKKNLSPKGTSTDTNISPKHNLLVKSSLDITLSQLSKTGFSDLAATLNMSPTSLSKMTLQDLTKCLEKLSSDNHNKETTVGNNSPNKNIKSNILNSECYSALRESIEEDNASFTAEFETHFTNSSCFGGRTGESLFDKYAVFRELLEEEKNQAISFQEGNSDEIQKQDSDFEVTSENLKENVASESEIKTQENPVEDRYAALREISLDEVVEEKYDADLSDKEDSVNEPSRLEEDTDLLPQSRPQSESTESPTITMKEHQSIIEATIMEEDISALDGEEEEVLEESVDETLKEPVNQTSENMEHSIKHSVENNGNEVNSMFSPNVQPVNDKHGPEIPKNDTSSWAKFDVDLGTLAESRSSIHSEDRASPWSAESKDNDLSPACRDKRKHRKMKRHKQNLWHEDEESEEGWDPRPEHSSWSPSWRENGWSDGDSMYDDTPPYVEREYHSPRRGRRRRVSPWNSRDQSPWEEEDREICDDQWENPRWQDEPRQRPKHRGPSWEDERRRHYEEPRKSRRQMMWTNEVDRKSSRESLTWEDEERYSKRNYGDRRRRKWDDDFHNRNRWRDREWPEGGIKMSSRYYKERGHDVYWDVECSDHADDESGRWAQRPRSCDRGRRQFSIHHSTDPDFNERSSERRYARNRDGHCGDLDYRRKAHTHQSQKQRRKHSQNSPFEDDFSSQFGFSKEMCSPGGTEAFESDVKQSSVSFEGSMKQFVTPSKQSEFTQYTQTTAHSSEYNKDTAKMCRSYQQSPFEDDFTPPEARRCSGRSASSELSDQRGNDDIFFCNSNENMKASKGDTVRRPKSATAAESNVRMKAGKSSHVDHSNSSDLTREFSQTDNDKVDISSAQHINERKQASNEFKLPGSLKRSDSSISLRKSESVNIFARNNDPFDDDFFSEESTKINRSRDKLSRNIISDTKWNESFDSFNFDK